MAHLLPVCSRRNTTELAVRSRLLESGPCSARVVRDIANCHIVFICDIYVWVLSCWSLLPHAREARELISYSVSIMLECVRIGDVASQWGGCCSRGPLSLCFGFDELMY